MMVLDTYSGRFTAHDAHDGATLFVAQHILAASEKCIRGTVRNIKTAGRPRACRPKRSAYTSQIWPTW